MPLIPETLRKKMMNYSAAAIATAAVPSFIPSAEAAIVYIPANQLINNGVHPITLKSGAVFTFNDRTPGYGSDEYRFFYVTGSNGGQLDTGNILQAGTTIGPANQFGSELKLTEDQYLSDLPAFFCNGACNVKDGYLGLEFSFEGQEHYGWVRLNIQVGIGTRVYTIPEIHVTITGFAYQTTPGTAITAGDMGPNATVAPGSLGMLALGAAGLSK